MKINIFRIQIQVICRVNTPTKHVLTYLYHKVRSQCMASKVFFYPYHLIFTTWGWEGTPLIAFCFSRKNHRHLQIRYVGPHDAMCFLPGISNTK